MRRIAAFLLVPMVACAAALAGCSSSGPGNTNSTVRVSGAFDKTPKVTIPSASPSSQLSYSAAIKGTGAKLVAGDVTLANVTLYKWSGTSHTLVDSTYTSGPQLIPSEMPLSGLATALKGATLGSRILAVLPPKYGWGSSGNTELGITGKDTLVWVIDLLQQYAPGASVSGTQTSNGGGSLPTVSAKAGQQPTVSIPSNTPPKKLSVTTLIQGTGPKLVAGDTVVAQYVGVNWRTGKVFSASWPSTSQPDGEPFAFEVGGQVIKGWSVGLAGARVGSRVMLVIPPSLGYGSAGQSSAGIKGTDTLVFVIDILGVQTPQALSS
jgi:FKBP-type peptidyl-prolyl cis-trans isomerase